jgi:dephospho-CoA kinase
MSIEQITARMATQANPDDLLGKADLVVRNDGTLDDLAREADRVWRELVLRNDAKTAGE